MQGHDSDTVQDRASRALQALLALEAAQHQGQTVPPALGLALARAAARICDQAGRAPEGQRAEIVEPERGAA